MEEIGEEWNADDWCSADMLLKGVLSPFINVEPVWIYDFLLLLNGLLCSFFEPNDKEKGFKLLFGFLCERK